MSSSKTQHPAGAVRLCPNCQIGYIMPSALPPRCETCLGAEHAGLSVMRLLGMTSASHVVVPLGLHHMRKLQRWFGRLRLDPIRHKRRMITVPPSLQSDLTYWKTPRVLSAGVPLGRATSHISVYTDASLFGWGGMCQSHVVGVKWPEPPSLLINCLELSTVLKVLKHFAPLLRP